MKSNRGITLISLIVYMVVLTIVISMLAMVSDLFFNNTNYIMDNGKYISEFNKFNMYFIEDVKNNSKVTSASSDEIIFDDGTIYTYKGDKDKGIYRNKVKICENISLCEFSKKENTVDGFTKNILVVRIAIRGNKLFDTTNEYVLKYW